MGSQLRYKAPCMISDPRTQLLNLGMILSHDLYKLDHFLFEVLSYRHFYAEITLV